MSDQQPFEDINVEDYKSRFVDGAETHLLLDVRTEAEFEQARIPGAVNIPLNELDDRIDEVEASANGSPIVVVCRSGQRSMTGAMKLRYGGLDEAEIFNLDTGTLGWARQNYPLDRG